MQLASRLILQGKCSHEDVSYRESVYWYIRQAVGTAGGWIEFGIWGVEPSLFAFCYQTLQELRGWQADATGSGSLSLVTLSNGW
jgi:hypothetical protein